MLNCESDDCLDVWAKNYKEIAKLLSTKMKNDSYCLPLTLKICAIATCSFQSHHALQALGYRLGADNSAYLEFSCEKFPNSSLI